MKDSQTTRFFSLDVLRGMTVCFMIIVNTPGFGAHPFSILLHAQWNGFTPTDLVFPTFLFVVGNAMSFSTVKFSNVSNSIYLQKVFKRTAIIFLLGFLMYWFPFFKTNVAGQVVLIPFAETRIMGVLQRIALCYCITSLMVRFLSDRWINVLSVIFILGYWLVLYCLGDAGDWLGIHGNTVYKLDFFLFGEKHLYRGSLGIFDPEGLLSTFPAVVNVIGGYYAGRVLRKNKINYETIAKLLMTGIVLVLLAIIWNQCLPINKKLWTGSFVCITLGLDLIILSFLIYIIDMEEHKKWSSFFIPFGENPLFIYLLSEILVTTIYAIPAGVGSNCYKSICTCFFTQIPGSWGSMLFSITYMFVCWIPGWILHKRHIYIKV
jgi:predicted acyltransferase